MDIWSSQFLSRNNNWSCSYYFLGAFGFTGIATGIVGTVASQVLSEGLADVWYSRGVRYRWDYENERYLTGTLVKYYRNSNRSNLIDSSYTERKQNYYT